LSCPWTLRLINKSTALYKIPANILRLSAVIIAPSLTYIFHLSLDTGIYVDWKRARVIPIYKSEDRRKCENYRPISILPIVSKNFEREVFRQLYGYLSNNSLLSKFQSGFRPKHSTLSGFIQMCDNLLKNMDSGQINCIVFFDVRRAFDSINHEILIDKMRNLFGVTGNQLRWFKSYLNNRVQQCLINGQLSSPKKIICGVPQGSILGPLLFLLT
jgi:retron-type reverse transcriptase